MYRLQGVINDKHIETIVRQMLKRVEVKDPGDSELLTGEVIDLLDINSINDKLRSDKRNLQYLREFYLELLKLHYKLILLFQLHLSKKPQEF